MMKKTIILAISLSMLLCLPITVYAQESENSTLSDDTQASDLPAYLLRENNFILDSYNISEEIRDYLGVKEEDKIVRYFYTNSLDDWFGDGKSIGELWSHIPDMKKGFTMPVYVVKHSDGLVSGKKIRKTNEWEDYYPQAEVIPDAIWSDDVIRLIDDDIRVKNAYVFAYSSLCPDGSNTFLVYYETDLGDYVYYRPPVHDPFTPLPGEHLLPIEIFSDIQKGLYDQIRADSRENLMGLPSFSFDYISVDLTTYDIHSANFHIDVPERPHTGLYIGLGIGGGVVIVVAVGLLAIRVKKRRAAREI